MVCNMLWRSLRLDLYALDLRQQDGTPQRLQENFNANRKAPDQPGAFDFQVL
jgi:hypothetical protein